MNEFLSLMICLMLGIVLGIFYFGGLWLTVSYLPYTQQPALLTLGSFLGRSMVCLFAFYSVVGSGLEGLASSLAGFILTKIVFACYIGTKTCYGR